MPVYLRNFYFRKLVDTKKKEHDAHEQANKSSQSVPPKIHRPNVNRTPK